MKEIYKNDVGDEFAKTFVSALGNLQKIIVDRASVYFIKDKED